MAAAAWVIGPWDDERYEPWIAHSTLLELGTGLFAAEAIALDEASAKVQQLLRASLVT